jgi:hypothetical protein
MVGVWEPVDPGAYVVRYGPGSLGGPLFFLMFPIVFGTIVVRSGRGDSADAVPLLIVGGFVAVGGWLLVRSARRMLRGEVALGVDVTGVYLGVDDDGSAAELFDWSRVAAVVHYRKLHRSRNHRHWRQHVAVLLRPTGELAGFADPAFRLRSRRIQGWRLNVPRLTEAVQRYAPAARVEHGPDQGDASLREAYRWFRAVGTGFRRRTGAYGRYGPAASPGPATWAGPADSAGPPDPAGRYDPGGPADLTGPYDLTRPYDPTGPAIAEPSAFGADGREWPDPQALAEHLAAEARRWQANPPEKVVRIDPGGCVALVAGVLMWPFVALLPLIVLDDLVRIAARHGDWAGVAVFAARLVWFTAVTWLIVRWVVRAFRPAAPEGS